MSVTTIDSRRLAEQQMARAKGAYDRACRAVLSGTPQAGGMVDAALKDLEAARAQLRSAPMSTRRSNAI